MTTTTCLCMTERDEARKALLMLVWALYHRGGYEDYGPTGDEALDHARDCLANWDMDPAIGSHRKNVRRILKGEP